MSSGSLPPEPALENENPPPSVSLDNAVPPASHVSPGPLQLLIEDLFKLTGINQYGMPSCPHGNKTFANTVLFMKTPNVSLGNITPYQFMNIDTDQEYVIDPKLDPIIYSQFGAIMKAKTMQDMVNVMYTFMCGTPDETALLGQVSKIIELSTAATISCKYGNKSANEYKTDPTILSDIKASDVTREDLKNATLLACAEIYEQKCYYNAAPHIGGKGTRVLKAKLRQRVRNAKVTRKLKKRK